MNKIYAEARTVAASAVSIAAAVSLVCALFIATGTARAAFGQGGRTMPVERRTEVLNRQGVEKI